MDKYLVIWPKSESVVHINYHYTQFGEYVDYLNNVFPNQIVALDCDVEYKDILDFIEKNKVKKIAMQVNYENAQNAFKMCDKIKQVYDIPILGYGSIPIMLPKIFLNSNFDLIFRNGDPEVCIKSFFGAYEDDKLTSELQRQIIGANLIKNGEFFQTENGRYILPDNWGMSKQEQVPIDIYDKIKGKNRYVINVSRGCPFGCPHCLIQLTEGRKERRRSIENLKEAISQIKDKYNHIKIWAANFTLDKEYVKSFCEMMKTNFQNITYECATRIDLVQDKEMLQEMYQSGCRQISLGIESINNGELIHTKDFKEEKIEEAIYNIQSSGMQVKGCIMLGMPNQQKESIVKTLDFLIARNVIIRPTIYTPYHNLTSDINIEKLSRYNRKTYQNNNVRGLTSDQLLMLVKDPYNFRNILDICKTERNEGEER